MIASPLITFDARLRGGRRLRTFETDEIAQTIRSVVATPPETSLPERYRFEKCVADYEKLLASTSTRAS